MNEKIIDVTMWMGSWTYPGDKPLKLVGPYSAIGEDKEFCYNFTTNSVDGTHIQAPHYMLKEGKKVNDFELTNFRRRAIVIDVEPGENRFMDSISLFKQFAGEDLADKAIILRCGVMDKLIEGEDVKDILMKPSDAQYLVDQGVKMIVADQTCLDDPTLNNGSCESTGIFCRHEVILVKQVCNLAAVTKKHVIVEAYPLKIKDISGTPCRAVVIEEN
jgi:kynurenine formamidase